MHRPCLIVRLGLACSSLSSKNRPRFAQALISQVEYGVLNLVDADNPQITVLVDCERLSPLKIPMKMLRSCSYNLTFCKITFLILLVVYLSFNFQLLFGLLPRLLFRF